jgi:hypothetical protein
MAIPENQLDTWSHQGAIQGSSSTYNTVKDVLEDEDAPYAGKSYSVFLQGSYGNSTNIWAESDVDVVICLNDCFQSDRSSLPAEQEEAWKKAHNDAVYTHTEFKRDVLGVLEAAFEDDVTDGEKAILIEASGNRRKTDVIVAIQFRRYFKFKSTDDQEYVEGICFYTKSGTRIVNYPRQHRENMTSKHQGTNEWLKPMVRVMKNLRGKLVADGLLEAGVAPSYFIEGLLYNVPADKFTTDFGTCFVNAVNWILEADRTEFVCANEQYYLLRDGTPTCWPAANGEAFLAAAVKLWNDW